MAALLIHLGRVPFDNGTLPLSKWYPMAPPETIMKIVSANEQINRNVNIIIYTYSQIVTSKNYYQSGTSKPLSKLIIRMVPTIIKREPDPIHLLDNLHVPCVGHPFRKAREFSVF